MKKTKYLLFFIFILLLSSSPGFAESRIIENSNKYFIQRNYIHENLGYFYLRKISYTGSSKYITSFSIPGDDGTITYLNSAVEPVNESLKNGVLKPTGNILIKTNKYNLLIGQGYTYKDLGSGTIKSIATAQIKITRVSDKWLITYTYSIDKNQFGIMWGVGSEKELIDLNNTTMKKIWSVYDLDKNARLSYDGYYFLSPTTYVPSEPGSYWRIPSAYLTNSLIKTGGSLVSDIMGNALLIISENNLNENGSLISLPQSQWLTTDYNITGSFFDTRFNADTMETFLVGYQKFKVPSYRDSYLKMAEYYLIHGKENHFKVYDGLGAEGWLVEDYYFENSKKSHCSLNHQLQAIHVFYQLYQQEVDDRYLVFADKLLQGIKNTRDLWIMENGNLEYAYLPDGTMGLFDYPYLTYNDLLNVQSDILKIKGSSDADLQILIDTKKIWMDANNVKGYRKK